jgi:hypothetical protein
VPAVRDDLLAVINKVCIKNGIHYLVNDSIYMLVEAVLPWYTQGSRDELVFLISGLLRKHGYSLEDAEAFVGRLCDIAGDEEKASRLTVVARTYSKAIEEIAGYSLLPKGLAESIVQIASRRVQQSKIAPITENRYLSKLDEVVLEPARSQLKGFIGEIISENGPRFVIADDHDMQVKEVMVTVSKEKGDKDGEVELQHLLSFGDIVLDAYPRKITQIHDPLEK